MVLIHLSRRQAHHSPVAFIIISSIDSLLFCTLRRICAIIHSSAKIPLTVFLVTYNVHIHLIRRSLSVICQHDCSPNRNHISLFHVRFISCLTVKCLTHSIKLLRRCLPAFSRCLLKSILYPIFIVRLKYLDKRIYRVVIHSFPIHDTLHLIDIRILKARHISIYQLYAF